MTAELTPPPVGALSGSGLLLIRAWQEPESPQLIRARLLIPSMSTQALTWATAAGTGPICDEVLRWLQALAAPAAEQPSS